MYIYLDVIILLNVFVNGIILLLTAWVLGLNYKKIRICSAVVVSVVYVISCIFYHIQVLYQPMIKILVSMAMIALAFSTKSWQQFFKTLFTFYLISFLLGGAVFGYSFFVQNTSLITRNKFIFEQINFLLLCKGLFLGICIAFFCIRPLLRNRSRGKYLYDVEIMNQEKVIHMVGFWDSGNRLYTMNTGKPVILVEKDVLKPLFSPALNQYLNDFDASVWIDNLDKCADKECLSKIELIAYRGIGSANLLLGFRVDQIKIQLDDSQKHRFDFIVGIYNEKLSVDGSYNTLLHSELFNY